MAEVDEQAFVNLFSFDAAPDSVRLPEDQVQLAINRDGTMYYLVDVDTGRPYDADPADSGVARIEPCLAQRVGARFCGA